MSAKTKKSPSVESHLPNDRDARALQLAFVLAPFKPRVARIPLWRVGMLMVALCLLCAWSVLSAVIVVRPHWGTITAKVASVTGRFRQANDSATTAITAATVASPTVTAVVPAARAMAPVVAASPFTLAPKAEPAPAAAAVVAEQAPPQQAAAVEAAATPIVATASTVQPSVTTTTAISSSPVAPTPAAQVAVQMQAQAQAQPQAQAAETAPAAASGEASVFYRSSKTVVPETGGGFLLQRVAASSYAEAVNVQFRMAGVTGKLQRGVYHARAIFAMPDGTVREVAPAGTDGAIPYAVSNFADRSHTFARPAPSASLVGMAVVIRDAPGNIAASFKVALSPSGTLR